MIPVASRTLFLLVTLPCLLGNAMAQSLVTFNAGGLARAADINSNFSLLDGRINTFSNAITVFPDRVALNRRLSFEPSSIANRKIVLSQVADDENQFYGFGVNNGNELRYQVPNTSTDHVFFAGTSATSSNEVMRIKGDGSVTIGTPIDANRGRLTVTGPGVATFLERTSVVPQSVTDPQNQVVTGLLSYPTTYTGNKTFGNVAIYGQGIISGLFMVAFSDARIKQREGISSSAQDLATLRGIEITDFHYVDGATYGSEPQKKVMAQQVESVFPQAVRVSTDVIPDVYKMASSQGCWIQLATDLKVGDRVRLIGERNQGVYEVLETRADGFRTAFVHDAEKVFVYGREVSDFRSVDYEAISMLNVSATQELARRLEKKDAEIAKLRTDNEDLRSQFESLAKDLAQLKASFAAK